MADIEKDVEMKDAPPPTPKESKEPKELKEPKEVKDQKDQKEPSGGTASGTATPKPREKPGRKPGVPQGPKKSVPKSKLKEEGLERTDNNLRTHTWPIIPQINQKNYYTEYLKRDEQIMVVRQQQEQAALEARKAAEAKLEASKRERDSDDDSDSSEKETEVLGEKVIVIHPGSQNLRVGLASDALPKSIPNVIARLSERAEFEEYEPAPKRVKDTEAEIGDVEPFFGEEFERAFKSQSQELRQRMRLAKRRILPNSKELVVSFNRRTEFDRINEHNDPDRVEWTEIQDPPQQYFVGDAALRVPDTSKPRYKLFWPIRNGSFNERDYKNKRRLMEDIEQILAFAIDTELGVDKRSLSKGYSAVLVIPDLYERTYVTEWVEMLFKDFGFKQICVMQESLSATYGCGLSTACIVDIGAQKTTIACVEEGMVNADSRINVKYGGWDVTEAFLKLTLLNNFPYKEINLNRRFDYLLGEQLKKLVCTFDDEKVSVKAHTFFVRAPEQETRKYQFKTYDEVMLAPVSLFATTLLDQSDKLDGFRSLFPRGSDLYDGQPNDPMSAAQASLYPTLPPRYIEPVPLATIANGIGNNAPTATGTDSVSTPAIPATPQRPLPIPMAIDGVSTPRSSIAGSPGPETPQAGGASTPLPQASAAPIPVGPSPLELANHRDKLSPSPPLDQAIVTSIMHAAKMDEKKSRDFLSNIMLVGGGALVGGVGSFNMYLEERLKLLGPGGGEAMIVVGVPPRELDPQVVVWKGASVFGRLKGNDAWINQRDYDMLGSRLLTYKCLWQY
ncbi:actin-like ATPase domain-containing protein [Ascobolus immersus RN42]|uniref:Actin-like ATPase domain-containing protein n=1 Tax=Ascobolus immersus RN42 TaxID=1160509 RepID=A0A3N4HVD7_ASCIM|nr:actin-like ATPase domain-containing protein [Ascobolus immersus RN42]